MKTIWIFKGFNRKGVSCFREPDVGVFFGFRHPRVRPGHSREVGENPEALSIFSVQGFLKQKQSAYQGPEDSELFFGVPAFFLQTPITVASILSSPGEEAGGTVQSGQPPEDR